MLSITLYQNLFYSEAFTVLNKSDFFTSVCFVFTGSPWQHRGWLGSSESLAYPLHVFPGPSLEDYRRSVDRAKSYTVLCTGRLEKVRAGVQGVLTLHGLEFDEIILKPNDNERYSRSNVKDYKRKVVTTLLKQFPTNTIKEVGFWDDRVDNIEAIESMRRGRPDIQFNLYHIKERRFCSDNTNGLNKTSTLFKKLGLCQDAEFKMAVREVVGLLTQAWNDVVGVGKHQVFPF